MQSAQAIAPPEITLSNKNAMSRAKPKDDTQINLVLFFSIEPYIINSFQLKKKLWVGKSKGKLSYIATTKWDVSKFYIANKKVL